MTAFEGELLKAMGGLDAGQQRQVLDYARALSSPGEIDSTVARGRTGAELLRLAGSIPAEDVRQMAASIRDGCDKIDPKKWQVPARHSTT